ncbi:hypothetical protein Q5752_003047 [Cryptotrichosporon argae]
MDGEPPQEEDFSSIPLDERSQHKNWKARLSAYNDIIAKSGKTASDSDPFFRPYVNDGALLRKWVLDANAVAQEKGIEAVLAIVQNSGEMSAKTRPEVVPALVEKALGNARAGTKKKSAELCAMYVEVENGAEGVITDVMAGLDAKLPKAVAGSVAVLKDIVESYGVAAIGNVKVLLKALPKIFGHSDKTVRAEGTSLTLALYTYLGSALLPALADLKPVQMTELQKSFDALDAEGKGAGTAKPVRFTRKVQREREAAEAAGGDDAADGEAGAEADGPPAVDPLSLLDPVDALKLFPADLMDRLASAKWKDRLEALEESNKVLAQPQNARISDANVDQYGPLVQTLGAKCQKDANVNVVMEAAKLLEGLARGMGKPFGRFKGNVLTECLERLKERKANVVEALGKGLDAIFSTVCQGLSATSSCQTTINDIIDEVLAATKSKNPQVKEGALRFLHRSLQATPDAPSKDNVKPLAESLVALLGDSAEPVRASAAECLGTMMKILGERAFNPYVENVAELQMAKVKDAFARAEIKYRPGGVKAGKPAAKPAPAVKAPVKKAPAPTPSGSPPIKASGKFDAELLDEVVPPKRAPPARFARTAAASASSSAPSSPPAKPAASRAAAPRPVAPAAKPAAKAGPSGSSKSLAISPSEPVKYRYTPEDAAAKAQEVVPADHHTKLADAAWKVRLEAAEEMVKWVGEDGGAEVSAKLYQVMAIMAEKSPSFGKPAAALVIGPLTDKLGDMKLKKPAGDALTAMAERTSLAFVLAQSYEPMTKQKAPKAQADALGWIKQQVIEFGIAGIPLRDLISFVKTALGSPNAAVRSSATQLLVQIKIFVGAGGLSQWPGLTPDISGFIEDLNPQLLSTINSEFDMVSGQTPPEPTRQQADLKEVAAAPGKAAKGGTDPLDDLIPRVDLDKLVASTSVVADSRADAWKVRKEAFESLAAVLDIKSNSRLKPNMGEIAGVLKKATADTNLAVKMLALGIISKIATGMGAPFEKYSRVLVTPVASVCADQKATTRSAALATLTAIADACGGMDSMYVGLSSSLEGTNPALRAGVLGWVAERIVAEPPTSSSDLGPLAAPVISCLEDRNGDVRKAAGAVLPYVVASAGFDHVMDQTSQLKPASKSTIIPLIQNARGAVSTGEPAKAPPAAGLPKTKAPVTKIAPAPASPRPGAVSKAPPARSLAMKALSSVPAPAARPPSASSDDRPALPRPRIPGSRPVSAAPSAYSVASSYAASRVVPFTISALEPRAARLKKDSVRWHLAFEAAGRADALDYLHTQMEAAHVAPEFMAQLWSKDHKAEEDFMAAVATFADFYDAAAADTFGIGANDVLALQLANVDLALKYAAVRLLSNNTQLATRSLEAIAKIVEFLPAHNERFSDAEAKLFLGDAKFVPKLAPVFDGLDKLIAASQVVQLLLHHGLEDKAAGKTCKNESLALIERAYRKRGSILRTKDDKGLYEAVAKCVSDSGTRSAALDVFALLQLQGGSKALQAVVDAMPAASRDMLDNRRATHAASKSAPAGPVTRVAESSIPPGSPKLGSTPKRGLPAPAARLVKPSAGLNGTPTAARMVPALSGLPRPTSRLPRLGDRPAESKIATPVKAIDSRSHESSPEAARPLSAASLQAPRAVAPRESFAPPIKPSLQPLNRASSSRAQSMIDVVRTDDPSTVVEALRTLQEVIPVDPRMFVEHVTALLRALTACMDRAFTPVSTLTDSQWFRVVKHVIQTLSAIVAENELVARITRRDLHDTVHALSAHLIEADMLGGDPQQLGRYLNGVLIALLSQADRLDAYAVMFDLLLATIRDFDVSRPAHDSHTARHADLVLRCLWKRCRHLDEDLRERRVAPEPILRMVENFLTPVSPSMYRQREADGVALGDLPLRTVKTMLQHLVVWAQETERDVYEILRGEFGDDAADTIVYSYLFRIANAASERAVAAKAKLAQPRQRLSNGVPAAPAAAPPAAPAALTSPAKAETEAERLIKVVVQTHAQSDSLDALYAYSKQSDEHCDEIDRAIASRLQQPTQTFVRRMLSQRAIDEHPRSPQRERERAGPASPDASPARPTSLGLGAALDRERDRDDRAASSPSASGGPRPPPRSAARPTSVVHDKNAPIDDQLSQLKAVFKRPLASSSAANTGARAGDAAEP